SQDYRRAGIPMLPVLVERKKSVLTIFGVTMLLVLASYIPYFLGFKFFLPKLLGWENCKPKVYG
ncbi:hypothetical protein DRO51_04205, partial [Candidatus Bathyarchaeota archaeon]